MPKRVKAKAATALLKKEKDDKTAVSVGQMRAAGEGRVAPRGKKASSNPIEHIRTLYGAAKPNERVKKERERLYYRYIQEGGLRPIGDKALKMLIEGDDPGPEARGARPLQRHEGLASAESSYVNPHGFEAVPGRTGYGVSTKEDNRLRWIRERKKVIEEYIDASLRGEKPDFWDVEFGPRWSPKTQYVKHALKKGSGGGEYSGVTDIEREVVKDLDKLIEEELGSSQKKHELLQEARFRGDPDEEEKRDALHSKRMGRRKKMYDKLHEKYGWYDDDYSSKTPPDLFLH